MEKSILICAACLVLFLTGCDKEEIAAPDTEEITTPEFVLIPEEIVPDEPMVFRAGLAGSSLGHAVEYQFDWGNGTLSSWVDAADTHTWYAMPICQYHNPEGGAVILPGNTGQTECSGNDAYPAPSLEVSSEKLHITWAIKKPLDGDCGIISVSLSESCEFLSPPEVEIDSAQCDGISLVTGAELFFSFTNDDTCRITVSNITWDQDCRYKLSGLYLKAIGNSINHESDFTFSWAGDRLIGYNEIRQYMGSKGRSYSLRVRARCKVHTDKVSPWSVSHTLSIRYPAALRTLVIDATDLVHEYDGTEWHIKSGRFDFNYYGYFTGTCYKHFLKD
jgi:hypothetical protein